MGLLGDPVTVSSIPLEGLEINVPTVVPIAIGGTADTPKVGLDLRKAVKGA